jgi:uncharacterized membrane protein
VPPEASTRYHFLDGLRGVALILLVINHTARDWIDRSLAVGRYYVVYGSVLLPAAIFLFLVGFCLPISFRRVVAADAFGTAVLKYFRRGIVIVVAGILLNVLIIPDTHPWSGGVLQTIGYCIIVLGPAMPLLRYRAARHGLMALAVLIYLAFVWSYDGLGRWSAAHPVAADILFLDFPFWPWISAAIIGLVLGWAWLEARARGEAEEARFFRIAAVVGFLGVVAYVASERLLSLPTGFGFRRDFLLNRHWTPRGVTNFLVIGGVATLLAGSYQVMQGRRYQLRWLVVLGQTALMLYFVHQFIELTLVSRVLKVTFKNWWLYGAANVILIVLLVYLGRAWLAIKRIARQRVLRPAASTP